MAWFREQYRDDFCSCGKLAGHRGLCHGQSVPGITWAGSGPTCCCVSPTEDDPTCPVHGDSLCPAALAQDPPSANSGSGI